MTAIDEMLDRLITNALKNTNFDTLVEKINSMLSTEERMEGEDADESEIRSNEEILIQNIAKSCKMASRIRTLNTNVGDNVSDKEAFNNVITSAIHQTQIYDLATSIKTLRENAVKLFNQDSDDTTQTITWSTAPKLENDYLATSKELDAFHDFLKENLEKWLNKKYESGDAGCQTITVEKNYMENKTIITDASINNLIERNQHLSKSITSKITPPPGNLPLEGRPDAAILQQLLRRRRHSTPFARDEDPVLAPSSPANQPPSVGPHTNDLGLPEPYLPYQAPPRDVIALQKQDYGKLHSKHDTEKSKNWILNHKQRAPLTAIAGGTTTITAVSTVAGIATAAVAGPWCAPFFIVAGVTAASGAVTFVGNYVALNRLNLSSIKRRHKRELRKIKNSYHQDLARNAVEFKDTPTWNSPEAIIKNVQEHAAETPIISIAKFIAMIHQGGNPHIGDKIDDKGRLCQVIIKGVNPDNDLASELIKQVFTSGNDLDYESENFQTRYLATFLTDAVNFRFDRHQKLAADLKGLATYKPNINAQAGSMKECATLLEYLGNIDSISNDNNDAEGILKNMRLTNEQKAKQLGNNANLTVFLKKTDDDNREHFLIECFNKLPTGNKKSILLAMPAKERTKFITLLQSNDDTTNGINSIYASFPAAVKRTMKLRQGYYDFSLSRTASTAAGTGYGKIRRLLSKNSGYEEIPNKDHDSNILDKASGAPGSSQNRFSPKTAIKSVVSSIYSIFTSKETGGNDVGFDGVVYTEPTNPPRVKLTDL